MPNQYTSPRSQRSSAATAKPSTIDADEIGVRGVRELDIWPDAILNVGLFITKKKSVYYGQVAREFPEYTRILDDVLQDLKLDGLIDFSEQAPAPVRITSGSMKRAAPFKSQQIPSSRRGITITHRPTDKPTPDSSSYQTGKITA